MVPLDEPASASMLSGRVVFHRVSLSEQKRRFLTALGYALFEAGTVGKVLRLARERRIDTVVTTLSAGGSAPERIKAGLDALEPEGRPRLLLAVRYASEPLRQRAAQLGSSEIYLWPEGVVGRLVEAAQSGPSLALRAAERLVLRQSFLGKAAATGGQIINISATGALVLLKEATTEDTISLSLRLPRDVSSLSLIGTVIRREKLSDGEQLALRFLDISPDEQARIHEFVRACNIINVGAARAAKPERKLKAKVRVRDQKRSDYFLVSDISKDGALLVPGSSFEPPFSVGTELELTVINAPRASKLVAVVEGREQHTDVGGATLTCWRVRMTNDAAAILADL